MRGFKLFLVVCLTRCCTFQDRLPHAFEVLDGAIPFGEDCVGIFLSRAKLFPSCHFTIVNADKLCSKSLEDVVSFLSDNSIALGNFTLHIIQRGDTLVHTSPWVRGVSWENTALATSRPSWAPRMLNGVALTVVESPSCGSGKTRFIREGLTAFETMGDQRQAATLVVHEASSICSLVHALVKKLGRSCSMGALHVSFTCVPTRSKGNEAWFLELNHFFFSLLALRMVYDPNTTTSFLLLPTEWQVFVEIPESSHCESTKNWLANNFPILFEFATFKQPRPNFFISNKARRVCMYLRALSTGTIDRKFEAGRQKRLILVLDCSSSMRGDPFQDALDNAVALFDSHVAIDDVSPL
jgi:hypothetical protein